MSAMVAFPEDLRSSGGLALRAAILDILSTERFLHVDCSYGNNNVGSRSGSSSGDAVSDGELDGDILFGLLLGTPLTYVVVLMMCLAAGIGVGNALAVSICPVS